MSIIKVTWLVPPQETGLGPGGVQPAQVVARGRVAAAVAAAAVAAAAVGPVHRRPAAAAVSSGQRLQVQVDLVAAHLPGVPGEKKVAFFKQRPYIYFGLSIRLIERRRRRRSLSLLPAQTDPNRPTNPDPAPSVFAHFGSNSGYSDLCLYIQLFLLKLLHSFP